MSCVSLPVWGLLNHLQCCIDCVCGMCMYVWYVRCMYVCVYRLTDMDLCWPFVPCMYIGWWTGRVLIPGLLYYGRLSVQTSSSSARQIGNYLSRLNKQIASNLLFCKQTRLQNKFKETNWSFWHLKVKFKYLLSLVQEELRVRKEDLQKLPSSDQWALTDCLSFTY